LPVGALAIRGPTTINLLLDTHALVWWATGDKRLSANALAALADVDNTRILSLAVAIEYDWLVRRSRVALAVPVEQLVERYDLTPSDLPFGLHRAASTLPPIHGDPIDRLLIAQAVAQGLTLVTRDGHIRNYPVRTLW
jgi:PIN domain nuclease of toxin-antitoxin system